MQQCRICFEEGNDLLTPCLCRGTAAYIHSACLDRYIQYYPDRVCRVCHAKFIPFETSRDVLFAIGIIVVFAFLLLVSTSLLVVKLALLGVTGLISVYFFKRNLFGATPIIFLGILLLLFLPGAHPSAVYLWLGILGTIGFFYTLAAHIPAVFVLGIVVTLVVMIYVSFLTIMAYNHLDRTAFSVYLGVLFLFWYGWVHDGPAARYRRA